MIFMNNFLKYLVFLAFALVIIVSCKREWENKYDAKADFDPVDWAPRYLQVKEKGHLVRELNWSQIDLLIDGFHIDRKAGDEDWQIQWKTVPKDMFSCIDSSLLPVSEMQYSYRVYAYAGEFASASQKDSTTVSDFAPINFQKEKLSNKSYKLSWMNYGFDVDGFIIDRKVGSQNWKEKYVVLDSEQNKFIDTNIFRTDFIQYRIYAFIDDYYSSAQQTVVGVEVSTPSELLIDRIDFDELEISWPKVNEADSYVLYRMFDPDENWDLVDTLKVLFYRDKDLEIGKTVYYLLKAINGPYASLPQHNSILLNIPSPGSFTLERLEINKVSLNWYYAYEGCDFFRIERQYSGGQWQEIGTAQHTAYIDSTFELDKNITYRISVVYDGIASDYVLQSFTSAIPTIENFSMEQIGLQKAVLTWEFPYSNNVDYVIDRKNGSNDWNEIASVHEMSYTDNSFQLNVEVQYRLKAYFGLNSSDYATASFYPQASAPENFEAQWTDFKRIDLSWDFDGQECDYFIVQRKESTGSWENWTSSETTSVVDEEFTYNTEMVYRVAAHQGNYTSSFSNEISVSTYLPEISSFDYEINSRTSLSLSWLAGFNGVDGIRIERRINVGEWVKCFETLDLNQNAFVDESGFDIYNDVVEYRIFTFVDSQNSIAKKIEVTRVCGQILLDPRDGKGYRTVQIGSQCWMAENLDFHTETSRCYDDNLTYCTIYGSLYDWNEIMNYQSKANTGINLNKTVCPDLWHLPSLEEWSQLIQYAGGSQEAGQRLKSEGDHFWDSSNYPGTDEFGFEARGGGFMDESGQYKLVRKTAYWWTSDSDDDGINFISAFYNNSQMRSEKSDSYLYNSVRCIRDEN